MSKNLSELSGRKGFSDALFDRYDKLSQETGSPKKEDLEKLAEEFLIGASSTYGTTTFYDFLKPENQGKKVYICNGSVCLCAGTQTSLKEDLCKHFEADEIGEMCCLGRCHENRAFHYQGKNYSGKYAEDLTQIIKGQELNQDEYRTANIGTPVLTREIKNLETFYAPLYKALEQSRDEVLEQIKSSGLRGRGGAGFPMGLKLQFCKNENSETKFIICNADEGDPGAFSDRYLLEKAPHAVLFGMMVAGYITGAEWGVLYMRGEYPESIEAVKKALKELDEHGLSVNDKMGIDFDFHFKIIVGQGSYICGEETALINSIEGQRPEVRVRPPYPAQQGLFNKPTVVNNVETLASLHYILEQGGDAYAQLGTSSSSGTKLVSLDSQFVNPGVYEVEMGTPLKDVIFTLGGGFKNPVKALHIGGPLGGLVPASMFDELKIEFESFKNAGFLLGHASMVSIPANFPMIKYLEHIFEFAAHESCGKCFPCRLGTKRAHELIEKARNKNYKIDKNLFDDLLHALETGSLCAHGGGIPLPVRNALQYFKDELNPYFN